jgi:hypothetical protein
MKNTRLIALVVGASFFSVCFAFAQNAPTDYESLDGVTQRPVQPQQAQQLQRPQQTQPYQQNQRPQQYQRAQPSQTQNHSSATTDEFGNKPKAKDTVVRTQYFYQPGAMKSAITLSPYYSLFSTETGVGGFRFQTVKYTEMVAQLTYQFGLTRNQTLGLGLTYGNAETKYTYDTNPPPEETHKETGLGDIQAIYQGLLPMHGMSLFYGLNFNYSGKKKVADATNSGDRTTGGMSFEPALGLQYRLFPTNILGAKLSYLYKMDRTMTPATGTDTKDTGGNIYRLQVFYEKEWGKLSLTPFAGYGNQGDTTTTAVDGTTIVTKGQTLIPFGIDIMYLLSKNLQFGGYYHGENRSAYTYSTLDILSYTIHQVGLAARFVF